MNDNSEFYTEDRAIKEEIDWILARPHVKIIDWLKPRIEANAVKKVIEFGCGSGIIAASLSPDTLYLGIDSNQHFLRMAEKRCEEKRFPRFSFLKQDIREKSDPTVFDLSMAWSFFKHFGVHEWNDIVCTVLEHGRFGAFNMQIIDGNSDLDNGVDYHHVHVSERRLAEAIHQAGHKEVERTVLSEWTIECKPAKDVAIWTSKV